MISVQHLVKDFGARRAVDDVSFEVEKGEVLGFLGPNGAGKSTTMRMITGFVPPTAGTSVVNGHDVATAPVAARREIGYLPENAPAYGGMTVAEFLAFSAEVRGFAGTERAARVNAALDKCFLQHVRNQTIDTLSKGYRQRTCFAQAILHDPPVLIMDEPTEGLDPNQKHVVRTMITKMAREKVIILSTHVLEEVEAICNRVLIISEGKLVADSTPLELRRKSRTFNALTVTLHARPNEAAPALEALPDVRRAEARADGDRCICRILPKGGQAIASQVMSLARDKGWLVTAVQTDNGRLDDVFRDLTITEDVSKDAQKED